MNNIPRKLKKIIKKSVSFGTTEFYNYYQGYHFPKFGIVFFLPPNMKSNRKMRKVIKFGKKIREAYYIGLFDL